MKKLLLILLKTLLGAVIFVSLLLAVLQFVLGSGVAGRIVDKAAAEYFDGDLSYSRISASVIRRFPKLTINLSDVALTYPHNRFPEYDTCKVRYHFLNAGRAEQADTLACLGSLTADVNLLEFLYGVVRVDKLEIDAPAVYARSFGGGEANWKLLHFDAEEKDSADTSGLSNLKISLGGLKIGGKPHILYIAPDDTVFASLIFSNLEARGFVRIKDGTMKVHGISFSLDSLGVFGRLPADTLAFGLDSLRLEQLHRSKAFNIALASRTSLFTGAFGRIRIPASLAGQVELTKADSDIRILVPEMTASLAYVPLAVSGEVDIKPEGLYLDAGVKVNGCELGKVLDEYARSISPLLSDVRTDAVLNLEAKAKGLVAKGSLPEAEAHIVLKPSFVRYVPSRFEGKMAVDLLASLKPDGILDLDVKTLDVAVPGVSAGISGVVKDVVGDNPFIKTEASLSCVVDSVMHMLPKDFGVVANGNFAARLKAAFHLSDLDKYEFKKAAFSGHLESDRLVVKLPADSIYLALDNPGIELSSGINGLEVEFDLDTLGFRNGASMAVRARGMRNRAYVSKEEISGKMVPFMSVGTADSSVFFSMDGNRVVARNVNLQAKASRRMRPSIARGRRPMPDTASFHLPDFLTENDFRRNDIRFKLGDKVDSLLKLWNPSGSVSVETAALLMPQFPLRTRIGHFDAGFDGNTLEVKDAYILSGTSDFRAKGSLSGLRGMLRGAGMLNLDMDASSSRINVNELMAAYRMGKELNARDIEPLSDEDESFVADSLSDSDVSAPRALVVVPANLMANVRLKASEVDYSTLEINDFSAKLAMRERCLQLADARIYSENTKIYLDAFYSTRTKKDIKAGLDVRMVNASARKIVDLIPAVDSILPLLHSFEGDLGCEVSATGNIDTNMNVIFPSLKGLVRISGENLNVSDAGDLRRITRILMFRNKNIGRIDNMYVDAVVRDNELEVYPFILGVDRYELALGGLQNFDKSFDYHISILRSPFLFKFGVNLFGDFDKWKFSLCRPKYRNGVPVFSRQLDSLQLNIADGIRNVLTKGVDMALARGGKSILSLEKQKKDVGYDYRVAAEDLSAKEYMQIDAMMVEQEFGESDENVFEEIDAYISQEIEQTAFDERLSARLREMRK